MRLGGEPDVVESEIAGDEPAPAGGSEFDRSMMFTRLRPLKFARPANSAQLRHSHSVQVFQSNAPFFKAYM